LMMFMGSAIFIIRWIGDSPAMLDSTNWESSGFGLLCLVIGWIGVCARIREMSIKIPFSHRHEPQIRQISTD
jgi:hypothetical protein